MEGLPILRAGSMAISESRSSGLGEGLEDAGPEPKLKEDIVREQESGGEEIDLINLKSAFYTFG